MPKGIFSAKRGIGKPFLKGHIGYKGMLGKKLSKRAKEHLSKIRKGNIPWNKGKKLPHLSGDKSSHWKGGTSLLRKKVKIRDDYTCQICGLRDPEIMEVDHILPRSCFKDKKFELNNLITLCPNCHRRKTKRDNKQYGLYKHHS